MMAEWSRGLESALGLSGVCPNSAGGSERTGWGPRLPSGPCPAKLCLRSLTRPGFPACTGDSPQGPRRCPHITHTCLSSPSLHIQATSRGSEILLHGESRPEVQGELLQAEPREGR